MYKIWHHTHFATACAFISAFAAFPVGGTSVTGPASVVWLVPDAVDCH